MNAWRQLARFAAVASAMALMGCYVHFRATRSTVPGPEPEVVPSVDNAGAPPTVEGQSTVISSTKSGAVLTPEVLGEAEITPPPGVKPAQTFLPGSKSDAILPGSKDAVPLFDARDVYSPKPPSPAAKETAPPAESATKSEHRLLPGSKSLAPLFQPTETGGTKSSAK